MATTNESVYLQDSTGGRRYWPVPVGRIDVGSLTADRDQLWAEAVTAYQAGEPWWIDHDDPRLREIEASQDARQVVDPWAEILAAAIDGRWANSSRVSLEEVYVALDLPPHRRRSADDRRIAAVMASIGYPRQRWREGGHKIRGYILRQF